MATPEPVTDDGQFDLKDVISHYESEEVTVGEAKIEPRCGERVKKQPGYLKDYVLK